MPIKFNFWPAQDQTKMLILGEDERDENDEVNVNRDQRRPMA